MQQNSGYCFVCIIRDQNNEEGVGGKECNEDKTRKVQNDLNSANNKEIIGVPIWYCGFSVRYNV